MHDDSPFLRQILAHPFDDGPRLVWADRLDERGECERAEFIRVQCELAKPKCCGGTDGGRHCELGCQDVALRRRERELIPRAWWAWCCPDLLKGRQWSVCRDQSEIAVYAADGPPEVELTFQIRRGFVGSVTLTAAEFFGGPCERCEVAQLARRGRPITTCPACRDPETGESTGRVKGAAAALFAAAPVTEVRLSDREPAALHGEYLWQNGDGLVDQPYRLPGGLVALLDGHHHGPSQVFYPTRTAAHAALSAALVELGRARADLPALARVVGPTADGPHLSNPLDPDAVMDDLTHREPGPRPERHGL